MSGSVAQNTPPALTFWEKTERAWDKVSEKLKIDWLNRKVEDLTNKMPNVIGQMLRTMWKVLPIVLLLLILPQSIVLGAFAIAATIKIIRSDALFTNGKLLIDLANGMGYASAFRAIGYALATSFSANPAFCVAAMIAHLMITKFCIDFANEAEARRNQAVQDHLGLGGDERSAVRNESEQKDSMAQASAV